jgi:ribonucleoside-diphosphate reductase beta chain
VDSFPGDASSAREDIEPLTALESFDRWERQQWSIRELDLAADREAWRALPSFISGELRSAMSRFFLGESAVTETLGPVAHAAPTAEARFFLTTQLADEARHTLFFIRYLQAVEDEPGDAPPPTGLDAWTRERWDAAPDYFSGLLDRELREVTDRAGASSDLADWYRGVAIYHLLVEGVAAVSGQRALITAARRYDGLATLLRGLQNVARDESRHIRFGVGALQEGARDGHADAIADQVLRSLRAAVWTVLAPERAFPALMPASARENAARNALSGVRRARGALLGRLDRIGIGSRLDEIAAAWDAAVQDALDDYQTRHGRRHPLGAPLPA